MATSTGAGCPTIRAHQTAVWTGTKMIVWGGEPWADSNTGGQYDPLTDTWIPTSTGANCPAGRGYHTAVWTGATMIVWGGFNGAYSVDTGGIYSLCTGPAAPAAANNGPLCEGGTLTLTASSIPGATYAWTGPNGFTSNLQNPSIPGVTLQAAGAYAVRASVNGCASIAGTTTVVISSWPRPAVSGATTGCAGRGVLLTTQPYASYQWMRGSVSIPGATGQSFRVYVSGSYSVRVTSAAECTAISLPKTVRINFCRTDEVSPPDAAFPLRIVKDGSSSSGYSLYFQAIPAAEGYNLYERALGRSYESSAIDRDLCGVRYEDLGTGELRTELNPGVGNRCYLMTAYGQGIEGVSGYDSLGFQISDALSACPP